MKHYFLHAKQVGDLTRIFVAALEDSRRRKPKLAALWQTLRPRQLEGFKIDGERLGALRCRQPEGRRQGQVQSQDEGRIGRRLRQGQHRHGGFGWHL